MPKSTPSLIPGGHHARRLSEKTIELSACTQIGQQLPKPVVWFGLTQVQEQDFGFDAALDLKGRAFVLQIKVSEIVLKKGKLAGCRRFACQHQQMDKLTSVFAGMPNACFYFLPGIGTEHDLKMEKGDVLKSAWLLDVTKIKTPVPPPLTPNNYHYVYLDPNLPKPHVTIRSDPLEAQVVSPALLIKMAKDKELPRSEELVRRMRQLAKDKDAMKTLFTKYATMAVFPD